MTFSRYRDNGTPLLVAATCGALLALKFLIHRGACVTARDVTGDGVVERAALNYHADIIEYFAQGPESEGIMSKFKVLKVWTTVVGELLGCELLVI